MATELPNKLPKAFYTQDTMMFYLIFYPNFKKSY